MKTKLTLIFVLAFMCSFNFHLRAQNPTYVAYLTNGVITAPNQFEFDIYVKRTGKIPFEVYGLQHCFIFDNAMLNGGSPSCILIPGTSEMKPVNIPANPNLLSVVNGKRVIKIAAKIPAGPFIGTMISNLNDGTRFGRFRLSTDADS